MEMINMMAMVIPVVIIVLTLSWYFLENRRIKKLREKAAFFEDKGW